MRRPRIEVLSTPTRYADAIDGAERFARDVMNPTRREMSRRTLFRSAGTLLVACVVPVSLGGCDPEPYILFLIEAIQVVSKVIKGEMKFSDPNDRCRTYQLATDLFTASGFESGVAVSNGLVKFDSCGDKEAIVPLEPAGLRPEQVGQHLLRTLYDGQAFASDKFGVQA